MGDSRAEPVGGPPFRADSITATIIAVERTDDGAAACEQVSFTGAVIIGVIRNGLNRLAMQDAHFINRS